MKCSRWIFAVICAVALVASACGGDDEPETTAAQPDDGAAAAAQAEVDAAQAEVDVAQAAAADAQAAADEAEARLAAAEADAAAASAEQQAEAQAALEAAQAEAQTAQAAADAAAAEAAQAEAAAAEAEAEAEQAQAALAEAEAVIAHDFGVDPETMTIRVGVNTDLSGAFAPLTTKITDGHKAYWEWLNANGGIQGWIVEPIVVDNAYDVPTHLENYEVLAGTGDDSVVMFSTSTGSPHTAAIAEALIDDNMAAIPLSWSSNWPDPDFGKNVFEVQTNYCIEGMNGATYMSENFGNKVAIATFPGEYGEDGAAGVKLAAEALGLEVVYDGTGLAAPGSDLTPVVAGIVGSGADWVWLTTNPGTAATLMGGAAAAGFTGQWSGNSPSWNPALLNTAVAPIADANYTHSTYTVLWGVGEAEGMQEMISAMREFRPDAPFDDVYIISWIEGYIATQILDQAISNGNLTRAGVLAAANQITVDLKGLAPNQTWRGNPNDNIVRETYLYDVDLSLYTPGATVSDEAGNNGYRLIKGPYASETAQAWEYERCVKG